MTRPPHPRWTDWASAIVPGPRDLAELIDLVRVLRDELRQGIRPGGVTEGFARNLAESAERLGYSRAASALRRCASACTAGLRGTATASVTGALRSLKSQS
jgi:hypothetical protein